MAGRGGSRPSREETEATGSEELKVEWRTKNRGRKMPEGSTGERAINPH